MTHDCFQEIDKAKNVARATWICSCGRDVSLMYFLYQEAIMECERIRQKKSTNSFSGKSEKTVVISDAEKERKKKALTKFFGDSETADYFIEMGHDIKEPS